MSCAHVSTNVLSCAFWKTIRLVQKSDNVVQVFCSCFAWWLQSGEQVLCWLVMSNLIDDGDPHSFRSQCICIPWDTNDKDVYLRQEAVLLENPLLSDISATLELSIRLLINTLHCALDWFWPLCPFLNSFRPRKDSRHVKETEIRETEIHVHFISPAVTRCVLTDGDWSY